MHSISGFQHWEGSHLQFGFQNTDRFASFVWISNFWWLAFHIWISRLRKLTFSLWVSKDGSVRILNMGFNSCITRTFVLISISVLGFKSFTTSIFFLDFKSSMAYITSLGFKTYLGSYNAIGHNIHNDLYLGRFALFLWVSNVYRLVCFIGFQVIENSHISSGLQEILGSHILSGFQDQNGKHFLFCFQEHIDSYILSGFQEIKLA